MAALHVCAECLLEERLWIVVALGLVIFALVRSYRATGTFEMRGTLPPAEIIMGIGALYVATKLLIAVLRKQPSVDVSGDQGLFIAATAVWYIAAGLERLRLGLAATAPPPPPAPVVDGEPQAGPQ